MAIKPNRSKPRSAGKGARAGVRATRRTTKRDRLVQLLKASAGREIASVSRELGWQPHTTRAALTRLRRAGYAIQKLPRQNNGASRYRIAGEPREPTSLTASMADHDERELAALAEMDRSALLERWRMAFGRDAPPRLSRTLMEKAIAYEVQVKAFGGLSSRTRRALRAAAKADGRSTLTNLPSRGTRLIREWHGTLHEVEVLEDGYLWRGARHRSLSAIARAITGTKWSGPRFFGLVAQP